MHLCPHCNKSHYRVRYCTTTCLATSEVWKDGVCEYHNPNTTTTTCECLECGKEFSYTEGGNSRFDNDVLDASTLYKTINGDGTPVDSIFVTGLTIESIEGTIEWRDSVSTIAESDPDIVKVVRCKNCVWWHTGGCAFRTDCVGELPYAEDFCSHGQHKRILI